MGVFHLAMFVFGGVLRGMLVQFLGAFFPLLFHGHAFNSFILALIGLPQKQNSSFFFIIMLSLKPHYPKSPSTRVKWDGTVTLYCFIVLTYLLGDGYSQPYIFDHGFFLWWKSSTINEISPSPENGLNNHHQALCTIPKVCIPYTAHLFQVGKVKLTG